MMVPSQTPPVKNMPALVKFAVDIGPLLAFMTANQFADIFVATGVLMAAVGLAFLVSWAMTRKIAILPLVTLGFVLVFGGLTLMLRDDIFIKMNVTISNGLFGIALLGGLVFGKSLLKLVFNDMIGVDGEGWRKMTLHMGVFLLAIAALNEGVWRSVSTDTWVQFKVFAIPILSIVFLFTQMPLIQRHMIDEEPGEPVKDNESS